MVSTGDFSLWRILDHTRFMIARSREMELSRYGLTPEQSHILDILHESDGATTINQLVDITQRQHHSISTLINRMARQGLVDRRTSPVDRRKYEVAITGKGEALVGRMTRESVDRVFAALSREEKRCLRASLMLLMKGAYETLGKELAIRFSDEPRDQASSARQTCSGDADG
jgi:DNA-binding MarR family transcriptional regulator